tara:strand:- start:532 stop:990 length:459 start_codon:yes stop_codon:yes gene_type:complete
MSLDLEKIKKELQTLPDMTNISQIGLQGTKDNLDPFLSVGTINKIEKYKETDFVVPIFDIPYINSIMAELKMFRTRLMILKPRECYTYHYDFSKRIHIPVITNESCFIVENRQLRHLPADGNYYVVDTTKMHTALNGSRDNEDRLHIVGGIV